MPVGAATGVPIGLRDLHYAVLTSDIVTAVVYATPIKIIGAITANVNPNPSIETLFGDDGPMETAATMGQIEVEMSATDINPDILAGLLGHTINATTGVMLHKSGDVAPWVALGFRSLKSNGKYKYVWLLKGKFSEPETKHETKGDKVAFQPAVIKGSFVKRVFDDSWKGTVDEDYSAAALTSTGTWFTKVTGDVSV